MLKKRILTASVLLLLLLPILYFDTLAPLWGGGLLLLILLGAIFEWSHLHRISSFKSFILATISVMLGVLSASFLMSGHDLYFIVLASLIWVMLIIWVSRLKSLEVRYSNWVSFFIGYFLIVLGVYSFFKAYQIGVHFLVSILCLAWVVDIFAYIGGRLWGNKKLAPEVSPGKTWAGLWTGVIGAWLMAGLWTWIDLQQGPIAAQEIRSLYLLLWQHSFVIWLMSLLVLPLLAIGGDLVESFIKRKAGVKDSSQLLPGHGGILDRIDSLLPLLPFSLVLYFQTLSAI